MSGISEEDEIEKAKALSLVTAQEDEKRRKQKYGGSPSELFNTGGSITEARTQPNRESLTGTSLISRPRPQARGVSRESSPLTVVSPTIPPRPDPQRLEQARLSHSHLHSTTQVPSGNKTLPQMSTSPTHTTSHSSAPPKPPPPKHPPPAPLLSIPQSRKQTTADSRTQGTEEKPLITLSDPFDFDLDSLDPLKGAASGTVSTTKPSSTHTSFGSNRSPINHSNSMDSFSSTNFNWDTLTSNVDKPVSKGGASWTGFTDDSNASAQLPYSVNPFAVASAGYAIMQKPLAPVIPPQPNIFSKTNSASTVNSFNTDAFGMSSNPFTGGQPFSGHAQSKTHKLSLSPTTGNLARFAQRVTRIPSDSNIVMSVAKQQAQESRTAQPSEFRRVPSIDTIEGGKLANDTNMTDFIFNKDRNSERNDDLITFGTFDKVDQCLSLASFDPLFSMDTISADNPDSSALFTNSPTTEDILQKVNAMAQPEKPAKHYNEIDTTKLESQFGLNQEVQPSSDDNTHKNKPSFGEHKRNISNGSELLDPFNISDLTSALEKKRQQHVREQEERKALLRKKDTEAADKTKEAPSTSASAAEKNKEAPNKGASAAEKRKRLFRRSSQLPKAQESTYETLQSYNEAAQDEVKAFCDMVARLKLRYPHCHGSNKGYYESPRVQFSAHKKITVKVVITAQFMQEPYIFTPSLESSVQHLICEVLLSLADNLERQSADDYLLKVHGRSEYFLNDSKLGDYEYVHNCLNIDQDIKLVLCEFSRVSKTLLRTETDDKQPVLVPKHREFEDPSLRVTRDKLNILMETYYREIEKLRDAAIQAGSCTRVRCKSVIQAVKAICATLYKIESADIIKNVDKLQALTGDVGQRRSRESFVYVTEDAEVKNNRVRKPSEADLNLDDLHISLEDLTRAVKGQIDLFCRTFHTDFRFESTTTSVKEKKTISGLRENLILHIATAHRLPLKWKTTYEDYRIMCAVYYAGQKLCPEVFTQVKPHLSQGLQDTYIWDEWIQFDTLFVNNLPREARLCLQLIGVKAVTNSDVVQKVNTPLGWVALQLFNHKFELVQGGQLLGLWHGNNLNPIGTTMPSTEWTSSVLLQINVPDFDCDYCFPSVTDPIPGLQEDFNRLHPMDQEQLRAVMEKDPTYSLSTETRGYLWEKRHYLHTNPRALPRVLQSVPAWISSNLLEIYTMIQDWAPLLPTDALELLLPAYPDTFVRTKAVEWISTIAEDELFDYLPQLIQALKFESYHTSALARMLIEKCITAPRVAHQIYWLLKEAADDIRYRKRYQLVFGAVLSVVGEAGKQEFAKEEDLVKILAAIAGKVKAAKEKENVLQRELMNMWEFFEHSSTRIPLNPAMNVVGLDVKSCSYFSSNAFPLKLVFKNIDPKAESIYTMFKSGDDLRQDMLTMQLIRIMDKLWLKDNLDLKIVTFRCQATGQRRGFVELVTESDTLRKIQIKHGRGVAGSFKDTTIREWLQLQNPTELEYEKAVDNFTASCAGYCVATYLLGICDRHNDNIMVKHSGHLFHIDFGKFLGDSQMFGNIKRDRTPFVLTPDMAYVINGGDKMGHRFQQFIDYCCTAFNVLRKHTSFFVNLFQLMVLSAIPGVNDGAIKYVQRALLPDHTDVEATAFFTRLIEESLSSSFTQFNFFLHNLAQMKFSGHTEGALLSFIPKTYSIHTDGRIKHIELAGFQKRYNPEKYYIYIIKLERENQKVSSFVFRRYSEFQELHHKLVCLFPLVRLPSLSNKVILGRTHVKSVAEERKLDLQVFLTELLELAPEIAEHDVMYTFCHPMLRDEQDINKTNIEKLREPPKPRPQLRKIDGQIKLSIFYKHDELTIMVMHVKDLAGLAGNSPDPYVKIYLLPDPFKETKRKTKIAKSTFHPTFNEMLSYRLSLDQAKEKVLSASVWNFDALKENEFLGSALIPLSDLDLNTETTGWYPLTLSVIMTGNPSPRSPAAAPGMFV